MDYGISQLERNIRLNSFSTNCSIPTWHVLIFTIPCSNSYLFLNQSAIAEAGGVKALVDLIFKWSSGGDGVLVISFSACTTSCNAVFSGIYSIKSSCCGINLVG